MGDRAANLPVAQKFPPDATNEDKNHNIDHTHDKACLPPFSQSGIARPIDNR